MSENNLDPQQNALFREIDEELRNDKIKDFWKKYRSLFVAGIILIILSAIAFEAFKYWRQQIEAKDAEAYTEALTLVIEGKNDLALSLLQKIADEKNTGYAQLARLKMVEVLDKEHKTSEAISLLDDIRKDTKTLKPLRDAATIALVQRSLNNQKIDFDTLHQMLLPLENKDSSWSILAIELSAMLLLKANQPEKAKEKLQMIANNPEVPVQIRNRIQNLSAIIDIGLKK